MHISSLIPHRLIPFLLTPACAAPPPFPIYPCSRQRGKAEGDDGLFAYEREAPKDVVYLGASQWIWVIARFGAHRGSYM